MPPVKAKEQSSTKSISSREEKISLCVEVYLPRFDLTYESDQESFTIQECEDMIEKAREANDALLLSINGDTVVIPAEIIKDAIITFKGLSNQKAQAESGNSASFQDDL